MFNAPITHQNSFKAPKTGFLTPRPSNAAPEHHSEPPEARPEHATPALQTHSCEQQTTQHSPETPKSYPAATYSTGSTSLSQPPSQNSPAQPPLQRALHGCPTASEVELLNYLFPPIKIQNRRPPA